MQLYIGNQNYSTWSLRPWLVIQHFGLDVETVKLKLFSEQFYAKLAELGAAAKVPTLVDYDLVVWDSLAICEYLNETYLEGKGWPSDPKARAKARSLAAEMHSGFGALRSQMPMNCRARRFVKRTELLNLDITRIEQIWAEQMELYPGRWLFGEWSIVDAMFAPVVLRFMTYQVELNSYARLYMEKTLSSPHIQQWLAEAAMETDVVDEAEVGEQL
ncbi:MULTISPECIES: glutathione S-transferase family protein [Aliagarivorans]|uniref:glutathione S-transferase family protein n=1 Tax=Aliagarivorans TaxID=882379 RepID=UPI00041835EE|nr:MULTISPECIES: glutathione S-transferase family protein [Aliagarivorans]